VQSPQKLRHRAKRSKSVVSSVITQEVDDGWIITDSSALGFLFWSPTYHNPKTFIIRNESMRLCAMINHFSDDVSKDVGGYFTCSSSMF